MSLAEYLVRPQVSVNILKLGTTRVYVLGEVKKPGLYELEKSHRVLDALGKAEGFTEKAAKKENLSDQKRCGRTWYWSISIIF